jgi:pSer/pThr/pTyr-binding forkhead associated (FHA) protein
VKNVILLVRKGPIAGSRIELELGRVDIGRDPGPDGVLLPGDSLVSRLHGELREDHGRIVYRNLSPNGTLVDRAIVREERELAPGAEIRLGNDYLIEVQFRPRERPAKAAPRGDSGNLWNSGPLARPAVRAILAVYLVALVVLAVFLSLRGQSTILDQFAPVRHEYLASYRPAGIDPEAKKARLDRADRLVADLLALERAESWDAARLACRELMAIDGDPRSPIYRFAARRLGALANPR